MGPRQLLGGSLVPDVTCCISNVKKITGNLLSRKSSAKLNYVNVLWILIVRKPVMMKLMEYLTIYVSLVNLFEVR